jgi:hypothetical protein
LNFQAIALPHKNYLLSMLADGLKLTQAATQGLDDKRFASLSASR